MAYLLSALTKSCFEMPLNPIFLSVCVPPGSRLFLKPFKFIFLIFRQSPKKRLPFTLCIIFEDSLIARTEMCVIMCRRQTYTGAFIVAAAQIISVNRCMNKMKICLSSFLFSLWVPGHNVTITGHSQLPGNFLHLFIWTICLLYFERGGRGG